MGAGENLTRTTTAEGYRATGRLQSQVLAPVGLVEQFNGVVRQRQHLDRHQIDQLTSLGIVVRTGDLGEALLAQFDQLRRRLRVEESEHRVGDPEVMNHRSPTEMCGPLEPDRHTASVDVGPIEPTEMEPVIEQTQEFEDVPLVRPLATESTTCRLPTGQIAGPTGCPRSNSAGRRTVDAYTLRWIGRNESRSGHAMRLPWIP